MDKLLTIITPVADYHHTELPRLQIQLQQLISEKVDAVIVTGPQIVLPKCDLRQIIAKTTGRSQMRNAGAKNVTTKWLLFVDADIIIPKETILHLLQHLQSNQYLLAGTALIETQCQGGNFRGLNRFLMKNKRLQKNSLNVMGSYLPVIDGAFFLVRNDVFIKVGGMNQEINWNEDIDLTHRLLEYEGSIECLNQCQVTEVFNEPTFKHFLARYYQSGSGTFIFNQKHFSRSCVINIFSTLRGVLKTTSLNLKDSEDSEERSVVIVARAAQLLGVLSHMFKGRAETKVQTKKVIRSIVVNDYGIFVYKQDQWKQFKQN